MPISEVHAVGAPTAGGSMLLPYFPPVYPTPDTGVPGPDNEDLFNASCLASDLVGNLVYASGEGAVRTADAMQTYIVVGVITRKTNATTAIVQKEGYVSGLFTHLVPGKQYFLGANGNLASAPFAAGTVQYLQPVGMAVKDNVLYLQPSGTVTIRDPGEGGGGYVGPATLTGNGPPDFGLGKQGDIYYDVTPNQPIAFYGPKSADSWGPARVVGEGGGTGGGSQTRFGDGPPDANTPGQAGDVYIDNLTSDYYLYS